jgi:predicted transcriptional regulator
VEQGLDYMNGNWHCEKVKNVTVSLDDDVYRRARMVAAARETSLSALVRQHLEQLGSGESEVERLRKAENVLRAQITNFRAADRRARDELHDRSA